MLCSCSHLAKVCSVAKDLINECEKLLHYGTTSEVVKKADKIIAQAQQYAHSEQDTTPVVTCCMEIDFSSEEELIQRVDTLGELLLGKALISLLGRQIDKIISYEVKRVLI